MKYLSTLILILTSFISFNSSAVLITFQLDMNQYIADGNSFTTPEWNSNVNGWCGATCNPMSDPDGDNIWEASVDIPQGTNVEYKFAVDDWNDEEDLLAGSSCTITNFGFTNRFMIIGADDQVLDPVCWESCADCASVIPTYDLTVTVDMSLYSGSQNVNALGMHIGGSFNGWVAAANPMTSNGDGTWSATLTLEAGAHEWKYVIGPNWEEQEDLNPSLGCVDPVADEFTNRYIDLQQDENLGTVCWNNCVDCNSIPEFYDVTFSVDMTNQSPLSEQVYVFGSFNGWCPDCNELTDGDGDNVYEGTVSVQEGTHEYKYLYGTSGGSFTEEVLDMTEDAACTMATDDGNGGFFVNRVFILSSNETFATVCFEGCGDCIDPTACVAENFVNAPTGLFEDQTVGNGNQTQLKFDHYSDATTACILKGGTISSLDPSAPFTQTPGQVLIQGGQVDGNADGHDFSALLGPSATFTLFNVNTFPNGFTGELVPGAFYKWQVQCGCLINPSLPLPDRLQASNIHISPWSPYDVFTNLGGQSQLGFEVDGQNKSVKENDVNIYPNPNNGVFVVDFVNFDEGPVNLVLRNMLGEAVHSSTYLNNSKNQRVDLDMSGLARGSYFVEIIQDSSIQTEMIVIE